MCNLSMLLRSLTSLLQCQCQPNAELENSFSKVMLRCSLTSLLQCQCQPNAELENSFSKVMLRCSLTSLLQCQCQPNAELENSFSKVMLRCSLTSLLQRYNRHTPKSKFFRRLISHLKSFPHPKTFVYPFVYGHFGTFSTPRKK